MSVSDDMSATCRRQLMNPIVEATISGQTSSLFANVLTRPFRIHLRKTRRFLQHRKNWFIRCSLGRCWLATLLGLSTFAIVFDAIALPQASQAQIEIESVHHPNLTIRTHDCTLYLTHQVFLQYSWFVSTSPPIPLICYASVNCNCDPKFDS